MITLFIPFYGNKTDFIVKTLDNIHSLELISKVIIVDDNGVAKNHSLWNHLLDNFCKVEIYYNQVNLGPSHSRNLALKLIETPYILFCDADVVINKSGLLDAIQLISSLKLNCIQGVYALENQMNSSISRYKHYSQMLNILNINEGETSIVGTSLFLIKTEVFIQSGGFVILNSKRASVEDRLLGIQLKRMGISNFLVKSFDSQHCHEFSLPGLISNTFYRAIDEIFYREELKDNINFTIPTKLISVILLGVATILALLFKFKLSFLLILVSLIIDLMVLKIKLNVFELPWIVFSFIINYTIGVGGLIGFLLSFKKKLS